MLSLHCSHVLQYWLKSLVWVLLDMLNVVILILFWNAASGTMNVTVSQLQSYYLLLLVMGTAVMAHPEEGVGYIDIARGGLSAYLLKPYSYFWLKFQQEIGWRVISGLWAVVLIVGMRLLGVSLTLASSVPLLVCGVGVCILGHLLSFVFKMCLGLLGFWFTAIRGVLDLSAIITIVCAGYLMPLSSYPEPVRTIVLNLPFAGMLYYPAAVMGGMIDASGIARIVLLQVGWLIVCVGIYKFLWRKGIATYTAVGQ